MDIAQLTALLGVASVLIGLVIYGYKFSVHISKLDHIPVIDRKLTSIQEDMKEHFLSIELLKQKVTELEKDLQEVKDYLRKKTDFQ